MRSDDAQARVGSWDAQRGHPAEWHAAALGVTRDDGGEADGAKACWRAAAAALLRARARTPPSIVAARAAATSAQVVRHSARRAADRGIRAAAWTAAVGCATRPHGKQQAG